MSTELSKPDQTITTLARACRLELRACMQLSNLLSSQWAYNRLSDFELWDNGVGASAREQDSLDLRLKDDETSKKVVLTSLNTLLAWIKLCRKLANNENSFRTGKKQEPDAQEEDVDLTLDEAMRGVEEIQALLVKLGVAIRQAGTASRLRNADRSFEKNKGDYQDILELEENLELLLRLYRRDLQFCGSQQEDVLQKPLGIEQSILIKANALRRFRFHFARSRRGKLQHQPERYVSHEAIDPISQDELQHDTAHEANDIARKSNQNGSQNRQTDQDNQSGALNWSHVNSNQLSAHRAGVSATNVESATTAPPTARAITSDYPKAPQTMSDYFCCPYCHFTIPSQIARNSSMWRKHVSVDLQPYTCYLPSCQQKVQLFDTFKAWSLHVSSDEHRSYGWICCYCDDIISFDTETSFLEHLIQQHTHSISELKLDDLVLSCQSQDVPTMDSCPVCSLDEAGWKQFKTGDPTYESKNKIFLEHIGDCLHTFALRALPVPDKEETEATSSGEPRFRSSQKSLLDMSTSEFSEREGERPGLQMADVTNAGVDIDPQTRVLAWRRLVSDSDTSEAWSQQAETSTDMMNSSTEGVIQGWEQVLRDSGKFEAKESTLTNRSSYLATAFDEEVDHDDRPYNLLGDTSLLSVPIIPGASSSLSQSVIAEVGSEPSLSHEDLSEHPWTLQESIRNACQQNSREQRFLPKGELTRLIIQESVSRELSRVLDNSHTPAQIQAWASAVCTETETSRNAKIKIKSFRKIFALLVLADMSATIPQFFKEDVSDLDLPLFPIKVQRIIGFCRKDSKDPLSCFRGWSLMKLDSFEDYQWRTLAAYFSKTGSGSIKHYQLQDKHILPFVASGNGAKDNQENMGGSGRVFMVNIHPDHHNFSPVSSQVNDNGFAVKQQMYEWDRKVLEREANILKMFSGALSHPHIVSLLATYEHLGKYHLVFHRAECNLLSLWRKVKPEPAFGYSNILWMAAQCSGIADGLWRFHRRLTFTMKQDPEPGLQLVIEDSPAPIRYITHIRHDSNVSSAAAAAAEPPVARDLPQHASESSISVDVTTNETQADDVGDNDSHSHLPKIYGRHGDIRPGNILWFGTKNADEHTLSGTLKITDLRHADLNPYLSQTDSRGFEHSTAYRAPECDVPHGHISQACDVWGLGCMFLEFVAWILGGAALLGKLSKERLTSDVTQNRGPSDAFFQTVADPISMQQVQKLKDKVAESIQDLHRHPSCTDFFHDLLNATQYDLLLINAQDRSSSSDIAKQLQRMLHECRSDITYATRANPWKLQSDQMESSS